MDWIVVVYALTVLVVGVLVMREEIGPNLLVKKNQRLGPTYWGVYLGNRLNDDPSEKTIVPPKPCKDVDGLAGGGAYAGGKAIHTARS